MTETWRRWLAVAVVLAALGPGGPALAQTAAPAEKVEEKGPQTIWEALFPPAPAVAQTSAAPDKKEEEKAKTLWDEIKLFAYIENSYTFNLTGAGRDATNELRLYDFDEGYTFNMAEFSI